MKIGPEHVGKKIKHKRYDDVLEVVAVHNNEWWGRVPSKSGGLISHSDCPEYELVEKAQKPSERINELASGQFVQVQDPLNRNEFNIAQLQLKLNCLMEYLDEQYEKENK